MDVPNTAVATLSTSDVPIAPRLVPRTRLFANSSSAILWKLLPLETSPMHPYTPLMCCPSSTLSYTIASHVLFTPKWSVTGLVKLVRTGKRETFEMSQAKYDILMCIHLQDPSSKVSFEGCHEPTERTTSSSHLR